MNKKQTNCKNTRNGILGEFSACTCRIFSAFFMSWLFSLVIAAQDILFQDSYENTRDILTRNLQSDEDHQPDKRIIQVPSIIIDTLEAERLFQPIRDSLLADYQKGVDKLQKCQTLTSYGKKKVKEAEDLGSLFQAYRYYATENPIDLSSEPFHTSVPGITGIGSLLGPLGTLGAVAGSVLVSHKSKSQQLRSRLLKNVKKGALTPDVIECLLEYNDFLADSLQHVSDKIALGWSEWLPTNRIPYKQILETVQNPYYRGYYYNNADTLDMLEIYQQRKGWEFLYDGTRIYKEDTYPIKYNYYIYDDAPQYKVDGNDLTVYNTNGQLVYVPSLTRKNTSVFAEIHRLVYFADYKNNKYKIQSESQHTQKYLNRMLGEKGGIEKNANLGMGIALALALSYSPFISSLAGGSLTPRQRGQIMNEFKNDYHDAVGENFIGQLTRDHAKEFGYIYMIERVSNVSFRIFYITSDSLKPSWCALVTYRTGNKPYTRDFSVKLIAESY